MTGYLTKRGEPDGNRYNLVVPNQEIRNIITDHILKLFKEDVAKDGTMASAFCEAVREELRSVFQAGGANEDHEICHRL